VANAAGSSPATVERLFAWVLRIESPSFFNMVHRQCRDAPKMCDARPPPHAPSGHDSSGGVRFLTYSIDSSSSSQLNGSPYDLKCKSGDQFRRAVSSSVSVRRSPQLL
jgi:hypothetical protein